MKNKETIEQAINRIYEENKLNEDTAFESGTFKAGIKLGIDWQAIQMFSEEEVKAICKHYSSILESEQDKVFVEEENWYEVGEENAFRKSIEKILKNREQAR
jgi:hypothetical protein